MEHESLVKQRHIQHKLQGPTPGARARGASQPPRPGAQVTVHLVLPLGLFEVKGDFIQERVKRWTRGELPTLSG